MYYDICINKLPPLSNKESYLWMNRLKTLTVSPQINKITGKGIKNKYF